jgi:hypothetical protein
MKLPTATHVSPNGSSRVTLRLLTCEPYGSSRVKPYGNSRVVPYGSSRVSLHVSCRLRLDVQVGFKPFQVGFNLFRFDFAALFFSDDMQTSCAAVAALTSFWLVVYFKDKKNMNASEVRS